MPTYTPTTWVNGVTPANAAHMSNIENGIAALSDPNMSVNGSGQLTLLKLALTTGSISRISTFSGTAAVGKVTVNHNLGATPDVVLICYNFNTTPAANAIGVNYATMTTTQVDIWSSSAYQYVAIAIKF